MYAPMRHVPSTNGLQILHKFDADIMARKVLTELSCINIFIAGQRHQRVHQLLIGLLKVFIWCSMPQMQQ